jgi:hypothetical protein
MRKKGNYPVLRSKGIKPEGGKKRGILKSWPGGKDSSANQGLGIVNSLLILNTCNESLLSAASNNFS